MLKKASELIPEAMQRILNPEKPRPDCEIEKLIPFFEFSIWDGPEDWGGKPVRPQLEAMLQAMWHFMRDIKEGKRPRWLSLLGSSGAGKTYLAKRFWKWYCGSSFYQSRMVNDDVQYAGQWCNWPDLAGKLHGNEGYGEIEELQDERICVIDEIGADRDKSGHVRNCLATVCSTRVNKFTIITSNLTMQAIYDNLDTRIASRMIRDGSVVIEVDVPDFSFAPEHVKNMWKQYKNPIQESK